MGVLGLGDDNEMEGSNSGTSSSTAAVEDKLGRHGGANNGLNGSGR